MRGLFRFVFKPASHDREVIRSVYDGLLGTTNFMVLFTMLFGGGFFVYTFIQQKLFMNSLLYHRLLYMLILLMGTVWFLVTTYFAKNSERRYRYSP